MVQKKIIIKREFNFTLAEVIKASNYVKFDSPTP